MRWITESGRRSGGGGGYDWVGDGYMRGGFRAVSGTYVSLPCSPSVAGYLRVGDSESSARTPRYTCSWAWPSYNYTSSTTTHPIVARSFTRCRFKRAQLRPTLTAGATIIVALVARNRNAKIRTIRATTRPVPHLGGGAGVAPGAGYGTSTAPAILPAPPYP
jgi:hypothetical protein